MKIKIGGRRMKTNVARVALAMAVSQVFLSVTAFAQQGAERAYHLASGPLDRTLVEIAQTANVHLSYDAALVQSLQSSPVDGSYSPEGAIRAALKGTGLELVQTASGALTIQKVKAAASASASSATTTANASTSDTVDTTLPLISVAAQRDSGNTGYVTESSSTFARTDTPISQTPTSVSAVNAAVIQSQSAQTLTDVLKNVAGVTTYPGPLGLPSYSVRGFSNATVLTDGMSTMQAGGLGSAANLTPTIAISSVEVLKGPAAILAGDAPAGGVINIEKKAPQADPFHEVQLSYAKYGNVMGAFDTTGALTSDNKLMYRLVLSDQQGGQNTMGYDGARNFYFAPTIEYKDRTTDITVGYDRTVSHSPIPQYTVGKTSGGIYDGVIDHPLGNASDGFTIRQDEVYYKLDQKLDDHVDFVSKANYTDARILQRGWTPVTTLSRSNGDVFMSFDTSSETYNLTLENYLRAKYDFGPVKTTTLVGWDYATGHFNEFEWGDGGKIVSVSNIFNPPVFSQLGTSSLGGVIRQSTTQSGLFLQEQANWERFHVLGSIRNSQYWEFMDVENINSTTGVTKTTIPRGMHQSAWTPNIGLLYQLTDDISAYANYQRGYIPSTATTFSGAYLSPQTSEQAEIGLKGDFLDDRLSVTAAAYRISFDNQNVSDPQHPGFSLAAGGAVSRGFELEVSGQLTPGWNIIGQYTYNDYVQPYNPKLRVNKPKNSANLWTTYNFQNPALQGFGVGLGLSFTGNQAVGSSGSYRIPSQLETDASFFYRHKKLLMNLAVKNVFNRNLYYGSTSSTFIPMGTTRTVMLTSTYDF